MRVLKDTRIKHMTIFMVRVYKGKRAEIKTHAVEHGESLNAFINRAIYEAMERDNAKK